MTKKISFKYQVLNADSKVDAELVLAEFQLRFDKNAVIDSLDLFDFVTEVVRAQRGITLG